MIVSARCQAKISAYAGWSLTSSPSSTMGMMVPGILRPIFSLPGTSHTHVM